MSLQLNLHYDPNHLGYRSPTIGLTVYSFKYLNRTDGQMNFTQRETLFNDITYSL